MSSIQSSSVSGHQTRVLSSFGPNDKARDKKASAAREADVRQVRAVQGAGIYGARGRGRFSRV